MKPRRPPTVLLLLLSGGSGLAEVPAFPGAEGHGRSTSGGRGGAVFAVTHLGDDGPGSLRAAVEAEGPRTVVFRVSGTIPLESNLSIRNGDLTIAGQTAPGDGICLANYSLTVGADNVIIRFIRVRVGDLGSPDGADGRDAIFCRYTDRVIVDHCSFSWSIDETASAYFNTRFTMQWCFVTESLRRSLHSKSDHGYGGIWGGQGVSFHHNLLAHHTSRNPRLNGSRGMPAEVNGIAFTLERADLRNNVIYNWSGNSCYGGEPRDDGTPSLYNLVGNYYQAGPATPSGRNDRIVNPTVTNAGGSDRMSSYYINRNTTVANRTTTQNNWLGVDGPSEAVKAAGRLDAPAAADPITEDTALQAYLAVLARGGACFPVRDSVDTRIVGEVTTGTAGFGENGIIDSQTQVGGWPELASLPAPADGDGDGMPDEWETRMGLDPGNPDDRNDDPDGDGHTRLEDYLNGLVNHLFPVPAFGIGRNGGDIVVSWNHQLNDSVLLESEDLGDWSGVGGAPAGSAGSWTTDVSAPGGALFYRLGPPPAP